MTFDRVCVIGAGSIGSLCAGHLGRVADVSVLVRRPEHAAELNADGLTVSGKSDFTVPVAATTQADQLDPPGLIIIATKAMQVENAAAAIEGRFPDATVMTIQNGLGTEEVVAARGEWPIVSAVTFMSGTKESDSHVHYELDTATWMGPFHPSGTSFEVAQAIGDLFVEGGLKVEVLPDLRPAQWSKLIFNASVNPVAALTDLPHVGLFARRDRPTDLGHLMFDLIEEGKRVATAAGVELFEDPWEMNSRAVQQGSTHDDDYAHVPSMLADVRAGRRTEIDFILGSLVREAQRHGVPAPLSEGLYRLVKARDRSYDD
ncbi:MAG: 2-dehydropantoate 2-reductase [Acidimicrobiia bacterium]|nr:2-dehydropantoate 2-reductase [Acidimicrobiia bacterium]